MKDVCNNVVNDKLVYLREKIATERYECFANMMKSIISGESLGSLFSECFENLEDEEIDDI